jgi:predicted TIM-barrel fold metal-dependent hydrolase
MKVFDAHFHLDKGTDEYGIVAKKKNVIFNSVKQYKNLASTVVDEDVKSLIFDYKNNLQFVLNEILQSNIKALKIHSRIQKIANSDYDELFEKLSLVKNKKFSIVVDAFYYGDEIDYQPNLNKIVKMAQLFPHFNLIIAHSGGIKVLEYFLHLKNFDNIYFDLSFSLSYLKHASVFQDFKVLLKFGNHQKILFGTDFPFIKANDQLQTFLEISKLLSLSTSSVDNILFENANNLFK